MNQITRGVRYAPVIGFACWGLLAANLLGASDSTDRAEPRESRKARFPRIAVTRGDRQSPMIALTFDDAPHPVYVPRLLALLRAENARATFFLVGEQLKNFPTIARQIVKDKHEIGNHSLTHKNLKGKAREEAENEVLGMQQLTWEKLGQTPAVYRPAYGYADNSLKDICEREGLDLVLWDVDTNDWRRGSTSRTIVQNVLDNTTSGSIILFHATNSRTVEALSELIPVLRYRGHKFVTLSELLADRAKREAARRLAPGRPAVSSPGGEKASSAGESDKRVIKPLPPIKRPSLPTP